MKKIILILLILVFFFATATTEAAEKKDTGQKKYVERTYFLKNVSADFAITSLRIYIDNYASQGNVLSVTIREDRIKRFEELLSKIDRKRKSINFRVFAVIGSHKGPGEKIRNKDLNNVLNELSEILSLNSFKLDGVGSLSVLEGSRRNMIKLSSKSGNNMMLMLEDISLDKDNKGTVSVYFNFKLIGYIESTTSIKENGYLVAGVSKIGKNGDSLILVINTEIE